MYRYVYLMSFLDCLLSLQLLVVVFFPLFLFLLFSLSILIYINMIPRLTLLQPILLFIRDVNNTCCVYILLKNAMLPGFLVPEKLLFEKNK